MKVPEVLEVLRKLQASIRRAMAAVERERVALRAFDVPEGLVELAVTRSECNKESKSLAFELEQALRGACAAQGIRETSVAALAATLEPEFGDPLKALYAAVRADALELTQEELVNHELTRRALACVRGYLATLAPRNPYDRRGASAQRAVSTVSARL